MKRAFELIALFGAAVYKLDADCVGRALVQRVEGLSPTAARGVATSLRCFLHCLASAGFYSGSLEGAVPRIPVCRFASLPQCISPEAVEKTIAACGSGRPAGILILERDTEGLLVEILEAARRRPRNAIR